MSEHDALLLELKNISVAVEDKTLFSGLDLDLRSGEIIAVCAPSGYGKTSLLRAIAGLSDFASGEVLLRGKTPFETGWPCYRRRVVLLDQKPVLFDMSVRENLSRVFNYKSASNAFDESRAIELLYRLGMNEDVLDKNARSLSVGEQQRVCLVRALIIDPQVLLMDEPSSALDEKSESKLEELIRFEASSRKLAALVVTHKSTQAERFADKKLNLETLNLSPCASDCVCPDGRTQ